MADHNRMMVTQTVSACVKFYGAISGYIVSGDLGTGRRTSKLQARAVADTAGRTATCNMLYMTARYMTLIPHSSYTAG